MNLVTGATGHIGNVLVRELIQRGEKVRALVLPGEDCTPLQGLGVELVEGDVLSPASLEAAFRGVRVVYHLAGIISITPGENALVRQVNVEGTRNMIAAACRHSVERMVYTSSIHAITRPPQGVVIDEALPFDPQNACGAYDRSKAEATLEVQEAIHKGLDAVIVCPTGVIGPFDYRVSEMGQLILYILEQKIDLWIDGAYDFVDVRDVARGMIQACEKGRCGEHYILSGEQLSLSRLIKTIKQLTGKRSFEVKVPLPVARLASHFAPLYYRLAGTRPLFTPYSLATVQSNSTISFAKARRELEYQPRSLVDSIADTIEWYNLNNYCRNTSSQKRIR